MTNAEFSDEAPPPYSIKLGSLSGVPFKTISLVEWEDIPALAVLTGVNGSGKTQFLHALARAITQAPDRQDSSRPLNVTISGAVIQKDRVALLKSAESHFQGPGANIGNIATQKRNFLNNLRPQQLHDLDKFVLSQWVQRKYNITLTHADVTQEQLDALPDDFSFMLEYSDVSTGLAHVFVAYRLQRAQMRDEEKTKEETLEALGPPPWEFVNDLLSGVNFGYSMKSPSGPLIADYVPKLVSEEAGVELSLNDLSSGEKAILRTILWFYNCKRHNNFPELFLLDEPDAHLHPSMTQTFIDILGILVQKYAVRIILTTHSPSTVALAPEDSVFVMHRDQPRIRRATTKAEAIGLLTSGLVTVSKGTKFILVEDEDDVEFYTAVKEVLIDRRDKSGVYELNPAPSLVFMRASLGEGRSKISGGVRVVQQWLEKLSDEPLSQMFFGFIDEDSSNTSTARVEVLGRYSMENYLLDPIVIFGVLVDAKRVPSHLRINISEGNEHKIASLPGQALQRIVDYVRDCVKPQLGSTSPDEEASVEVKFTNGVSLRYPSWMLTKQGHSLQSQYRAAFGASMIVSGKLLKSMRRVGLIPIELAQSLKRLQQAQ